MTRTVVYRQDLPNSFTLNASEHTLSYNINDVIGLDGFLDYSIKSYLEDLAQDGLVVSSVANGIYSFVDGTSVRLKEAKELINIEDMNPDSQMLVLKTLLH